MSSVLLVLVSEERKRYFPVMMMQSNFLATFSSVSPWRGGEKGRREIARTHTSIFIFKHSILHFIICPSSPFTPHPSPQHGRRSSVILVLTVSSCFSPLVTSRLVTCEISWWKLWCVFMNGTASIFFEASRGVSLVRFSFWRRSSTKHSNSTNSASSRHP